MEKKCILDEDKRCDGCGNCNRCDLDDTKICDNCMKCMEETEGAFRKLDLGTVRFITEEKMRERQSRTSPEG